MIAPIIKRRGRAGGMCGRVRLPEGYSELKIEVGANGKVAELDSAEIGHHHHIAGPYLLRYAQEATLAGR